jgi:hypothetical protein
MKEHKVEHLKRINASTIHTRVAKKWNNNPNAVLPLSTDEKKNFDDAIETAATLYYEKKKECIANGNSVPYGFGDACIDKTLALRSGENLNLHVQACAQVVKVYQQHIQIK